MKALAIALLSLLSCASLAQNDEQLVNNIFDASLSKGMSYAWLDHLSNEIGGRLSGSENAAKAVLYAKSELEKLGLDRVWLQPVMVPKWVRGDKERAQVWGGDGSKKELNVCALGGSVATPAEGLKAGVIEVQGIEELRVLPAEAVKGKIVFFNRPMESTLIHTFQAYGGCVDQRHKGAMEASMKGASGVVVRSMNLRLDDYPHTGSMSYGELSPEQRIPAAAISTNDAEFLSQQLKVDPGLKLYLWQNCEQFEDVESHNVIGEIRGSEFPDQYILVGGHLDSWDLGDGSHDDGAGVVQSMEVLRLLKKVGVRPKRSIRVVLFMNEENGLRGGKKYAEQAKEKGERHIFALESDSGGFTPRGFSFDCGEEDFNRILSWKHLFKPYLIHYFEMGGSGADIGPLKSEGIVLAGLRPDSQRYFDHHHASNDTFDAINRRELELGAATMASLVYLVDSYGTASSSTKPIKD